MQAVPYLSISSVYQDSALSLEKHFLEIWIGLSLSKGVEFGLLFEVMKLFYYF